MEHQVALDILIAELFGQETQKDELQQAYAHVSNCRSCLEELQAVLRLIEVQDEGLNFFDSVLTCAEEREHLAEYAELDEATARARFPKVARHLETCAECRRQEQTLRTWLAAGADMPAPEMAVDDTAARSASWQKAIHERQRVQREPTSIWQEAGVRARRLFTDLQIRLAQTGARLGELPLALQPMQVASNLMRGKGSQAPATVLRLEDTENNLQIELRLTSRKELAVRLTRSDYDRSQGQGRLLAWAGDTSSAPTLRARLPVGGEVKVSLRSGPFTIRIEYGQRAWIIPLQVVQEEG